MSGWFNKVILAFVVILLLGYFLSDRQKEQVKDKADAVVDTVAEEAPDFFAYVNNLLDRFDPRNRYENCCDKWLYGCIHSRMEAHYSSLPLTSISDPDFYDPDLAYLDIDVNGK